MQKHYRIYGFLLFMCLIGCTVPPPRIPPKPEFEIKIGLVWGKQTVKFSLNKKGYITSHDGVFTAKGLKNHQWQAEVIHAIPAKVVYRLVLASRNTMEEALQKSKELKKIGLLTEIKPIGRDLWINDHMVHQNMKYRIYWKKDFIDYEKAKTYRDAIWNHVESFIVKETIEKARGIIRLTNLKNGQQFESSQSILIKGSPVTLYEVPVGKGYHWEHLETRIYPETILFNLDSNGLLAVINKLPLEKYLQGVVPAEMPPGFPKEALKAQAVAARCEAIAKLGVVHQGDPFDLCSDVHCQVYGGLTKQSKSTNQAVKATKGLIMMHNGEICDAIYGSNCGGHGEDVQKAWGGQPKTYLTGEFDGPKTLARYGPLYRESNVIHWINDNPIAFCNTVRGRFPEALEYTKKYFRWEKTLYQDELGNAIREKIKEDIGEILDLIPLSRGSSGRIIQLRIVGKKKEVVIRGELNIRKTLSSNTLWSSCFYIKQKDMAKSIPRFFILKGAGFGHGVGMCQTGAAVMALNKIPFHRILKHYYKNIKIQRLY